MYSYLKNKFILEIDIRPQNINWQDWKYTSFVIFIFYSQNILCHSAFRRCLPSSLKSPYALWRRMFWLWWMKTSNDVHFQSCQLMFRSLKLTCDSVENLFSPSCDSLSLTTMHIACMYSTKNINQVIEWQFE